MPIHETLQVDWRNTKMSAAWPPSLKPLAKYLVRAKASSLLLVVTFHITLDE